MTAIAGSAATGRATGRSSRATRVDYRPYQEVAAQYPAIPLADFQRAVQYITPDGHHASAAEASFLTLSHARGKGFWLALYRKLPGFAAISEWAYAFIAAHRAAFYRVSLLLWGRDYEPPRYDLVSFLFLRLFGLIYLSAFVSFGVQAQGLIGSHGILPLAELVDAVGSRVGVGALLPDADGVLVERQRFRHPGRVLGGSGAVAAAGLQSAAAPEPVSALCALSLAVLWRAGLHDLTSGTRSCWRPGFLALLLSFATVPGIWLLRWLLFRFMFMSGVVKLLSGDPNWWNLSALSYHFLTQPLPTPLAWYAAHLPPRRAGIRHRRHVLRRAGPAVPDLLPAPAAFLSPPSASCCCKAAFCSPAITTGSISRPCCCACCCSTTRRCKRYCRGA